MPRAPAGASEPAARQSEALQHTAPLEVSLGVQVQLAPEAVLADSGARRDALREAAAQGPAEPVFWQPSLVAVCASACAEAEAAAAAAAGPSAPLLAGLLAAVREAGSAGLAQPALAERATGLGGHAPELAAAAAEAAAEVLLRHGLVRRVLGWDAAHYVAAEHSQVGGRSWVGGH